MSDDDKKNKDELAKPASDDKPTPDETPAADKPADTPADKPADETPADEKKVDESKLDPAEMMGELLREREISKVSEAYPDVPKAFLEIAQVPGQAEAIAKVVTAHQKDLEQKALDKVQNVDVADAKPSAEDLKATEKKLENSGRLDKVLAGRLGLSRA